MVLRSIRERVIQTLSYEIIGLVLISPLVAAFHGMANSDSVTLLVAVSLTCLAWVPIHNSLFDLVELRCSDRLASDRPQCWRLVHAASLEITSTLVTVPVILWFTGYGFWRAVLFDVSLTLAYMGYAYLFHLTYDRLRPIAGDGGRPAVRYP